MTIYETLVKLLSVDLKDNISETVQFEDLIKKLEKIRGKRYYIFEYKDVEKTLRTFKIEIKMPVFETIKLESERFLRDEAYDPLIANANLLNELSGYPNGTMLDTYDEPAPIHGWNSFQNILSNHMENIDVGFYGNLF